MPLTATEKEPGSVPVWILMWVGRFFMLKVPARDRSAKRRWWFLYCRNNKPNEARRKSDRIHWLQPVFIDVCGIDVFDLSVKSYWGCMLTANQFVTVIGLNCGKNCYCVFFILLFWSTPNRRILKYQNSLFYKQIGFLQN